MSNLAGKTMFVSSDKHYSTPDCEEGGVDPAAESCALQAIEIVKPDIYVDIGDVGEWNSVSHWKFKKVKRPPLQYQLKELEEEARHVNLGLDRWDKVLKRVGCREKHLTSGNHETWVHNLCIEHPYLTKEWTPDKLMKLSERGYKYHQYGKYVRFGKLAIYHGGHFSTKYHAFQHASQLGVNTLYGHNHDVQVAKIPTLDSIKGAWSIGCLCKMDKAFLKGRPTNWSHAFAIVHFFEGGRFNVEIVEILEGVCHVWGKKLCA